MSQPPPSGPGFTAPDFAACYRHPERMTGISCRRCKRPICGECMNPASVGFQCPKCIASGRSTVRQPRTAFGAVVRSGSGSTTYALMGVLAAVWLLDLVTRGLVDGLLIMSNQAVAGGQFWRLVTAALTSGGLLGTLMILLVLWIAGRTMESELGRWRMLALYFAAGLGGTTLLFLLGPLSGLGYAAPAAVIGLLAANSIFKYKQREDVRADIGLFVLLILYSVLVGFNSFGWLILIGGLLIGALVGAVLAYAPRQNRATVQVVGLLGVIVLCLAAVTAKLVLL
ncbi:MAG TPA: rhomboid family intramembrane serine protease [Propionibacteriaceae bacterium]|nr:rhomboid family intramembrane serine protease [Propionibacteriaceae bacterium]